MNASRFLITNEMLHQAVDNIVEQIEDSGISYNHIIGLCRGGIVPAGYLSYRMGNIPVTCLNSPVSYPRSLMYDLAHANVLLIDNIATTGATLSRVVEEISSIRQNDTFVGHVNSCALFARHSAFGKVDYIGKSVLEENESRLVFPWESLK